MIFNYKACDVINLVIKVVSSGELLHILKMNNLEKCAKTIIN